MGNFKLALAVPLLLFCVGSVAPNNETQHAASHATSALSPSDLLAKVSGSIVRIESITEDGVCLGSGVAISEHLVVTNAHVLNNTLKARVCQGEKWSLIKTVVLSNSLDLAVFEVPDMTFKPVTLASGMPILGSVVYTVGNPLGRDVVIATGLFNGVRPDVLPTDTILFTAPISPGSSGGALLNDRGELIGITTASLTKGQQMNLAIPVTSITKLVESEPKVVVNVE